LELPDRQKYNSFPWKSTWRLDSKILNCFYLNDRTEEVEMEKYLSSALDEAIPLQGVDLHK